MGFQLVHLILELFETLLLLLLSVIFGRGFVANSLERLGNVPHFLDLQEESVLGDVVDDFLIKCCLLNTQLNFEPNGRLPPQSES